MWTLADAQARFKKLSKLIYVHQQITPAVLMLKKSHIAFVDQVASTNNGTEDDVEEFDMTFTAVMPLTTSINSVTDSINKLVPKIISGATSILQNFVAIDLGLVAGSSLSSIGTALIAQMNSIGATVQTDSTGSPNPTGIHAWFLANLNIDLPQSDSPTIPDSYITDVVI